MLKLCPRYVHLIHTHFFLGKSKIILTRIVVHRHIEEETIGRCAFWWKKNSNHIIHSHSVLFSSNAQSVRFLLSPFSFRLHERVSVWVSVNTYALWNYGLTTLMNEFACLARAEKKTHKNKNHFPYTLRQCVEIPSKNPFGRHTDFLGNCVRRFVRSIVSNWRKYNSLNEMCWQAIRSICHCVNVWVSEPTINALDTLLLCTMYIVWSYSFGRCLCCCDILHISHSDVCKQTFKLQLAALFLSLPVALHAQFQHFLISTSDKNLSI